MSTLASIRGQRFNRLLVVERDEDFVLSSGRKIAAWKCLCDCGKITKVSTTSLRNGKTKSCGCYAKDQSKARTTGKVHHNYRHGMCNHPAYNCWSDARKRVLGLRKKDAKNYIDRGISMCDRWLNSFENFVADMGDRPPGTTLERMDNNLGYSPENCCWATRTQQARNRRNLVPIDVDGVSKIASIWSEETGVKACTITDRIKRGWPPKEAVFTLPGSQPYRARKTSSPEYGELPLPISPG